MPVAAPPVVSSASSVLTLTSRAAPWIIALDIGTSSVRALLFQGARVHGGAHAVEIALHTDAQGRAEIEPNEVMDAVVSCVRAAAQSVPSGEPVASLALSCAMHSLILLDSTFTPLTPALTWADARAAHDAIALRDTEAGAALYHETGTPIHSMSPLCKLAWLKHSAPALHARAAHVGGIKDLVVQRLSGAWETDVSSASATGLMSLHTQSWSAAALVHAGLTANALPTIRPITHAVTLNAAYAHATGLAPGTPVILGGADGCLANLGSGVLASASEKQNAGDVVLTIGTSGALRMASAAPATDPQRRTFCYALDHTQWVTGGATNGGGLALRWLRDNFPQLRLGLEESDPYRALAALAAQSPTGADGLLFHPYLAGERAPLWNAHARASFIGLHTGHGPTHLVRAVMEGILLNLAMILAVLEELNGPCARIIAGGGFARSDFWLQMAADVFDRPLHVNPEAETTAQGAALIALSALGLGSLEECATALRQERRVITPTPLAARHYAKIRPLFAQVPATLAPLYSGLAALGKP